MITSDLRSGRFHTVGYILCGLVLSLSATRAMADPNTSSAAPSLDKLRAQVAAVVNDLSTHNAQVSVHERIDRIGPSVMLKLNVPLTGDTPRERAEQFINQYQQLWGRVHIEIDEIRVRAGRAVITLTGRIDGLPLLGQESRLSIKDGRAQHLSNGIGALISVRRARVDEAKASAAAIKALGDRAQRIASVRRAAYPLEPGVALEVFELRLVDPARMRTWVALVDGRDGSIIQVRAGEVH